MRSRGSARSRVRTSDRARTQPQHGRPGEPGRWRAGAAMMRSRVHTQAGTVRARAHCGRTAMAYASGCAVAWRPGYPEAYLTGSEAIKGIGQAALNRPGNPVDRCSTTMASPIATHLATRRDAAQVVSCTALKQCCSADPPAWWPANPLILLDIVASLGTVQQLDHPAPLSRFSATTSSLNLAHDVYE